MFGNLGLGEILIIAVIALIIIGPEKFPDFAKIALRAFRDFRGYIDDIKHEMDNELNPLKKEIGQLARYKPEEYIDHLTKAVASIDDDDSTDAAKKEEEPAPPAPAPQEPQEPPPEGSIESTAALESAAVVPVPPAAPVPPDPHTPAD